jgi:hypothetical protein
MVLKVAALMKFRDTHCLDASTSIVAFSPVDGMQPSFR